jgi:HK97 family phage prohead protease
MENDTQISSSFPPSSFIPQPSSLPPRQRWLTLATEAVDRAGDILILAGMDAENFLNNPQFLWQHGASGAQVNTIGKVLELRIETGGLFALVEYAPSEISPLAEQIYQMDLAGMLPANSIGFSPIEYEANEFGGYTFTKWELIECSKVELPMNPEAVDTAKSLTADEAADWLLT